MTSFRASLVILFLFVASCSFKAPDDRVREYSQADPGFVIMKNSTKFASTQAGDPDKWEAQANLTVTVCLGRTFGWRQMEPGIDFQVELADTPNGQGKPATFTTLPDGCWDFHPTTTYPFARKKVGYLKKYLIVHGTKDELGGLTRVKPIYIDPWNQTVIEEWNEDKNGYPEAPDLGQFQLQVQGFTLEKIRWREVSVNRDLKMSYRIPYNMSFYDRYARERALSGSPIAQSVWPKTRFAVTGVLLAPTPSADPLKPEDLVNYKKISGFSTTVEADPNGGLTSEIAFEVPFEDLPYLETRVRLVLDITPLSSTGEAPEPTHLIVSFQPRAEMPMTYPTPYSKFSAQEILAKSDLKAASVPSHPELALLVHETQPASLALTNALRKAGIPETIPFFDLDKNQALPGSLKREDVAQAVHADNVNPDFIRQFAYLFSPQPSPFPGLASESDQQKFLNSPMAYVQWTRFSLVDEVDSRPQEVRADMQTLAVAANVYKQTAVNTVEGEGQRKALGSEINYISTLGFNAFGTGTSKNDVTKGAEESYFMHEIINIDSAFAQEGLARIENFTAERVRLELTGKFRDCLALQFRGNAASFLFCAKRTQPLRESYYYVTDQAHGTEVSLLDFRNLAERDLFKLFRGEDQFARLQELLRNSHMNLMIEPGSSKESEISLAGVNGLHSVKFAEQQTARLHELAVALVKSFGNRASVGVEDLHAYLRKIQSEPNQAFLQGNPHYERFNEISTIFLKTPGVDKLAYFKILNLFYLDFQSRGLSGPADQLLKFAERMSQL